MSHIILHYVLSEEAQRAELAAGRPAHIAREFQLEPTVALAEVATINTEGNATIKRTRTSIAENGYIEHEIEHRADHVLADQADALAFLYACDAAVAAKRLNILAAKEERDQLRVKHDAERVDREAAEKIKEVAQAARENEARRRFETEVQDWAAEHGETRLGSPELKRAARERRDVVGEVRRLSKERIIAAVTEIVQSFGFVVYTYESKPREGVPSREAYALLDVLKSALLSTADAAGVPGAEASVSDILRHDVAPEGAAVWRTGVTVTVSHPWFSSAIEVDVTSEAPPEDEEDDEY